MGDSETMIMDEEEEWNVHDSFRGGRSGLHDRRCTCNLGEGVNEATIHHIIYMSSRALMSASKEPIPVCVFPCELEDPTSVQLWQVLFHNFLEEGAIPIPDSKYELLEFRITGDDATQTWPIGHHFAGLQFTKVACHHKNNTTDGQGSRGEDTESDFMHVQYDMGMRWVFEEKLK